MKGENPPVVKVIGYGGLELSARDFKTAILAVNPAQPPLVLGQRVILLLAETGNGNRYPVPFAGQYQIGPGGLISAVEGNPFAGDVAGMSAEQLVGRIRVIVEQSGPK